MIEQHHLSERRACRLVGLSRDAYRHPPVASALNAELSGKIVELAHVRRRFGYRRIHDLLRPALVRVNLDENSASIRMRRTAGPGGGRA
jgi:putative transposase